MVVIDSNVFSPEYQLATHQLMLCTGGFGSYPNARGRTCFCTSLYDGHNVNFYRQDVLGVLDADSLPKWAKPDTKRLASRKKKGMKDNEF